MKTSSMTIIAASVALLWPCLILAADMKPHGLILGKWTSIDDKDKGTAIEFNRDGTFKVDYSIDGMSFIFNGAYKFADDKTLEITTDDLNKKGETKTEKLAIKSLADDSFVLVDAKGKERSLRRVIMTPPAPPMFPKKGGFN